MCIRDRYGDMILVMTVEPGFGGQKFMDSMLPKIREIREYLDKNKPECDIEVDGGIGEFSIADSARAGAKVFVIGTASFRAEDMKGALDKLVSIACLLYTSKIFTIAGPVILYGISAGVVYGVIYWLIGFI